MIFLLGEKMEEHTLDIFWFWRLHGGKIQELAVFRLVFFLESVKHEAILGPSPWLAKYLYSLDFSILRTVQWGWMPLLAIISPLGPEVQYFSTECDSAQILRCQGPPGGACSGGPWTMLLLYLPAYFLSLMLFFPFCVLILLSPFYKGHLF